MSTTAVEPPLQAPIPFNRPFLTGKERHYVLQAIERLGIASDGPFTHACARLMEERFGIAKVLMTPSCTAALEMAASLCDVGPGDEVILPSYTFVSTANAFVRLGARPVFVDIRADTLNLDESRIEAAVTSRTRAIVPVHYAGVACEMQPILELASRHGLTVIEDAAQGVNCTYHGRALGSLGALGTYSFHETKNITCGEGGALCINAPELIERAEIIRDKGTDRARFFRGEVDKYTWIDVGSSYIPTEMACAFLLAQLEMMDAIKMRRARVDGRYRELLGPLEEDGLLRMPYVPEHCESHCRTCYILLSSRSLRDGLMDDLRRNGIACTFHFVPLHCSPMGERFGYREGDLPRTEDLSGRILRLPSFADISETEQLRVARQVASYLKRNATRRGYPGLFSESS